MSAGSIDLSVRAGIAHLRLNRPDRLNALDTKMVDLLSARCRELERDDQVRVVILSGEGKAFSAGGDINAWSTLDPVKFGRHWIREGHTVFDSLARLRQPLIAVLDGHALGGGLELAACADVRVAEKQVKIGLPETGLGIIPGWSGTQRAVRRFGSQIVRRMALFGEVFSAEEALGHGLVDRVVETSHGMDAAMELANSALARGPLAIELAKMMIAASEGEERERVLEAIAGTVAASGPDLAEGLAAFRDGRAPAFGPKRDAE